MSSPFTQVSWIYEMESLAHTGRSVGKSPQLFITSIEVKGSHCLAEVLSNLQNGVKLAVAREEFGHHSSSSQTQVYNPVDLKSWLWCLIKAAYPQNFFPVFLYQGFPVLCLLFCGWSGGQIFSQHEQNVPKRKPPLHSSGISWIRSWIYQILA